MTTSAPVVKVHENVPHSPANPFRRKVLPTPEEQPIPQPEPVRPKPDLVPA